MASTWGEKVKISIFGESHSDGIGVVIEGLPAGEKIDINQVLLQMKRRAPGRDKSATTRKEADAPNILSGFAQGKTEGSALCAVIGNTNTRSQDYNNVLNSPRPGHSDYTAYIKYKASNDIRGGGHFSGRLTAPLVFAGAVARQILENKGITIAAHAYKIAGIKDETLDPVNVTKEQLDTLNKQYFSVISLKAKEEMAEKIEQARLNQDSVGGVIECAVIGLPVGLGDPMFGGVESKLASILYGIPAVKAVEFGCGFACANMYGSENNDEFYYNENAEVKTYTNNCGGILGGITNSMPLMLKVAVKPTPSISKEQKTVDLVNKTNTQLVIKGRHDPCIVPRAIPVVESAVAIALLDMLSLNGGI
ncbi:MAG: chorismate synthase [Clostridia bacterium]